jgi:hypothetical protein
MANNLLQLNNIGLRINGGSDVSIDFEREKMPSDKLQQLYDNYLEFTDHMVGVHGSNQVAAVMITQALSIYRSTLDEQDYNQMVDMISASRTQIHTFNKLSTQ